MGKPVIYDNQKLTTNPLTNTTSSSLSLNMVTNNDAVIGSSDIDF